MTNSQEPANNRRYSSEEVADIIRLSLQDESRKNSDSLIDYDELIAIAKDVGVSSDQIDRAVFMLQEEQQTREKERALWSRFKGHALRFCRRELIIDFDKSTEWFRYILGDLQCFWLGAVSAGPLCRAALCPTVCGNGHATHPQYDGQHLPEQL